MCLLPMVAIKDGDTIEVERLDPVTFSVTGLVQKPGAFPYLPGRKVNLMQALAEAGGLNDKADPQFAKVYRQAEMAGCWPSRSGWTIRPAEGPTSPSSPVMLLLLSIHLTRAPSCSSRTCSTSAPASDLGRPTT